MDRDDVVKALTLHSQRGACMNECPYGKENLCGNAMARDALALICELTEEKEQKDETIAGLIDTIKDAYGFIVRKMQERLEEEANYEVCGYYCVSTEDIDQIAKEMLEGENNDGKIY